MAYSKVNLYLCLFGGCRKCCQTDASLLEFGDTGISEEAVADAKVISDEAEEYRLTAQLFTIRFTVVVLSLFSFILLAFSKIMSPQDISAFLLLLPIVIGFVVEGFLPQMLHCCGMQLPSLPYQNKRI